MSRRTMECSEVAPAAAEEDEGRRMVACELEAAETLAEMAHCAAAVRCGASGFVELRQQHAVEAVVTSQDQLVAAEPATVSSREKAEKIVKHIPTQLCSTSYQSNPLMKFKRKLTEAEREERKIRRVMANRESARQTIRRRQAMHLELTRKADNVLEENENLKKQKEQKLEEYNSLKGRNDFLKAKLADAKKVALRETEEERKFYEAGRFCSTTASTHNFQNHPAILPCFWPYIIPPSDVFPFQYASHPHNMSSSQFPMPPGDPPCLHQGQSRPGPPLFVVPVPWLLPMLTHDSSSGTHSHQCGKCSCSEAKSDENIKNIPSSQNTGADAYNHMETVCADGEGRAGMSGRQTPSTIIVPGLFSPVRRETVEAPRSCQVDDSTDLRLVSALVTMRHGLLQEKNICSPKKGEEAFVATEARRRRKELMKLKNMHCKGINETEKYTLQINKDRIK